MSIFRREDEKFPEPVRPVSTPSQTSASAGSNQVTHIAAGCKVTGELQSAGQLVIDGEVDGQIHGEGAIVVGRSGRVKGQIEATTVRVGGQVRGNVRGRDRVELLPEGRLEGDVSAPRVAIADGAFFKGKVSMSGDHRPNGTGGAPAGTGDAAASATDR